MLTSFFTSLELKEKLEERNEAFRTLNDTHYEFKVDVEVDKEFAKEECRKTKVVTPPGFTKIATCQASLTAKNNSLNTLREKYLGQSVQLGNVTSYLKKCRHDLNAAADEISGHERASVANTKGCEQRMVEQKKACDETARGYKRVVSGLQHHLQCLETEDNCKDVAEFYICMPREMAEAACLLTDLIGYELFGLKMCNLPGDSVMAHFNVRLFIQENPRISSLLILVFVLASIGGVTLFTVITWLLIRYRQQFRRGCNCLFTWIRSCRTAAAANSENIELPPIIKKKKQEKVDMKKEDEKAEGVKEETGATGTKEETGSDKPTTSGVPKVPSIKPDEIEKVWKDEKVEVDAVAAAAAAAARGDSEKPKK